MCLGALSPATPRCVEAALSSGLRRTAAQNGLRENLLCR